MQECYLTAVIIMDSKGNLIAQEYTDEYGADELNEYLDSTSLIDVVDNTEKTYAIRIDCEDGSYVDLSSMWYGGFKWDSCCLLPHTGRVC